MSDLRDARLKKALDQAPDEDARPADAVREAILHKARLTAAAAATPRRARWGGTFGRPWNSALATFGVVAFVGVLVWSQGLLEQHPEEYATVAAPRPAAPASVAVLAQPSAPLEALRAAPERKPASLLPKARAPQAVAEPQPPVATGQLAMPTQDAAVAVPPQASPPSPAAPADRAFAPTIPHPAAALPLASPAPAAPAPQLAARAAAQEQRSDAARGPAQGWTALLVSTPQGAIRLSREQLPAEVAVLLSGVGAEMKPEAGDAQMSEAVELRVELLWGQWVLGTLELGRTQVRWNEPGRPPSMARPVHLAELRALLQAATATAAAAAAASAAAENPGF